MALDGTENIWFSVLTGGIVLNNTTVAAPVPLGGSTIAFGPYVTFGDDGILMTNGAVAFRVKFNELVSSAVVTLLKSSDVNVSMPLNELGSKTVFAGIEIDETGRPAKALAPIVSVVAGVSNEIVAFTLEAPI